MITFEPLTDEARNFLAARTGGDFAGYDYSRPRFVCATSRNIMGQVDGVLTGEFTEPWQVHMSCAVDDPKIISRRLLRAIFSTFFSKAVRVTAMCRPDNRASEAGIRRLGFRYEGFMRLGIEGKWDALVFGMLRHECRWLRQPAPVDARFDHANGRLRYAVAARQFTLRDDAAQGSDLPHGPLGQLDPAIPFAPVVSAVPDAVALVPGAGVPSQVPGVDAEPVATGVRHVVSRRARAVKPLADKDAHRLHPAFAVDDGVALMRTEGHDEAVLTMMNNSAFEKSLAFSVFEAHHEIS